MKKCGTGREGQKGLINFLLTVREAKVVVLLTETGASLVDVSFRSVPGLEVSTSAVRLNGGGHPQAAGCTLKMPLAEAGKAVMAVLKQSLEEQGFAWSGGNAESA